MNFISKTLQKKAEKLLSNPSLNIQGKRDVESAIKKNDSAKLQKLLRNWIRNGI